MAEEIGHQERQTPSDDEVRAASDGHQERRVDVDSKSDVITSPHYMPRAQSKDTTGEAIRSDQRQQERRCRCPAQKRTAATTTWERP